MSLKIVHIVAFDIPYPVNHGGFFDLFYKLITLHQRGIQIYLHCFEYGRQPQSILTQFCKQIYYYKRKTGIKSLSLSLPYIVASRRNDHLIERLSEDTHPILLEGTHCTFLLYKKYFPNRTILYRLHNIESIYYKKLFQYESNVFKRCYYLIESWLLQRYENIVAVEASTILTVSEIDMVQLQKNAPDSKVKFLPVFMPQQKVKSVVGQGTYALYHGNLSIGENDKVAKWLIENVFKLLPHSLVIAGRNPSKSLISKVNNFDHVRIVCNPDDIEMQTLISEAHINIVMSFNQTGVKLKLLNSLFNGRFCIVNTSSILNSSLDSACVIADNADVMQEKIKQLFQQTFEQKDIALREKVLYTIYNNEKTAEKLIEYLYSHCQ